MRVPIPIAILLAVIVVAVTWWRGTSDADFTTPPTEEELSAVQVEVESSLPQAYDREDAISVPPIPQPPAEPPVIVETPPEPPLELGDLDSPPELNAYQEHRDKGPSYLIDLASLLESEGEIQRALLAWERVLDSATPDTEQAAAAIAAARRLRPTLPDWISDPAQALPITLHAGTGKKLAPTLKPILADAAKEVERASSGILKVSTKVATGSSNAADGGPAPVALWISGANPKTGSTEVLSFTVVDAETLPQDVLRTTILLIRNHFEKSGTLTPPVAPPKDQPARTALELNVTRLTWQTFGRALNPDSDAR